MSTVDKEFPTLHSSLIRGNAPQRTVASLGGLADVLNVVGASDE